MDIYDGKPEYIDLHYAITEVVFNFAVLKVNISFRSLEALQHLCLIQQILQENTLQ